MIRKDSDSELNLHHRSQKEACKSVKAKLDCMHRVCVVHFLQLEISLHSIFSKAKIKRQNSDFTRPLHSGTWDLCDLGDVAQLLQRSSI